MKLQNSGEMPHRETAHSTFLEVMFIFKERSQEHMIKGILFDVDNTLIDFYRFKEESCNAAIDAMINAGLRLNKTRAKKDIYAIFQKKGLEYPKIFDDFLMKTEGRVDYRKLARAIIAYRNRRQRFIKPYTGVETTLAKLKKKGLKIGILSDAPRLKAWMRLCTMGIEDYFDFVVTFDDTGQRKPHPKPFAQALGQMKLRPEEILMVGDNSKRDIDGGRKLGMHTAFAAYGSKDRTSKADHTLRKFSDVLKMVR
jgi:putative hydrolase of the HAD superfamily